MATSPKREDLVVRYVHRPPKAKNPPTGMIAQTMPMASMFMRNKLLSWVSFSVCLQHFMNYRNVKLSEEANSPLLSLVLSLMGVLTAYIDIFIPTPQVKKGGESATESVIENVSSAVSSVIETVTSKA